MVKYIGADKQGNANDTFRGPGLNPQALTSSDKSFQFANQQQQQLGESLKGSLQFQSQTAARMSEDFSRTNANLTEYSLKASQIEASNDGSTKALKNLADVGEMIVKTLDNRSKQEAAQTKAVRENNAAQVWERVSQWEVDAPAKARLDPGGLATLRNEARDLLNTTEGADLLPEDREKLMKHVYGNVIAGIASKNVEDVMTQQRKVQETNDNLATQRTLFESSTLIASLANSNSPDEQGIAVQKLSEYAGAIILNNELNPGRKAEMLLGLTTAMNKAQASSEDNQFKIRDTAEKFNTFQADVNQARATYPNDIDAQESAIAYSAMRNNIPTSISDKYDLVKAQERANQRVKLNNESTDLRSQEVARSLGVAGTDDEAGYDAQMFSTESSLQAFASSLGNGNAKIGMETPRYRQVVAAQKLVKEYRELTDSINVQYAQLQGKKAQIARGDAEANISYLKSLKPSPQTDDLIKRIQLSTGNNPALQQLLPLVTQYDAMDKQAKAQYDAALSQAYAGGFGASNELVAAIDAEATALTQKRVTLGNELVRYGFRVDGSYDPAKAKRIEQTRVQEEARRQAQEDARYTQQGSQGGTANAAPFDQGGGYFNGLEVFNEQSGLIMPITKTEIKRQGAANINEGVGYGRGRLHAGQDIGLDMGTPISAQMDGRVTRVWADGDPGAGTSGNTIEITYPDGSAHTFMHLQELPRLAVGQRVRAGQVIAKVGNTGLEGGNSDTSNSHLHWEVRYGDKLSTPQEWSAKYREQMRTAAKQPRGGGVGSSITAPTRGVQGVPIKGGVLLPDGKGGATVASYRGSTLNVSGVKHQYGIPTPTSVDKTKAGQVLVQRTGHKGSTGLEDLVVTVYDKDGGVAGEWITNSGSPIMQDTFGKAGSTTAGSNSPLEYGQYTIGKAEPANDIPSMRSDFIPIEPQFNTERSLLGIHFDGDRAAKPGSAGCIVFPTKSAFDSFKANIQRQGSKQLTFSPQIRDSGQQKQRPTHTPANPISTGREVLGPGGVRFTRDIAGNLIRVPDPVGYSDDGVRSSKAGYSNAAPLRNIRNSNRATDYNINDVTNHHGFKALQARPAAARAVNEVARDFGVPGEWLAEVISVETGNTFDPNQKEYGGSGATGLIQFYPDVDGGSTKTINGRVYQLAELGRMTIEQQLRGPVKDYITEAMRSNGMKTIPTPQDLYALIWAYGPASKALRMNERNGTTGREILNRLGKFSGRKYSSTPPPPVNIAHDEGHVSDRASKLTAQVDRRPRAGCATCVQMTASNMFVPHERVNLNTGMELFNLA